MLDPQTPVLIGVGAITQRIEGLGQDSSQLAEPIELMHQAALSAERDAGAPGLLQNVDLIAVPKGIWDYPDAARQLASLVGAKSPASVHTVVGEVGILQQTLISRACSAIAEGESTIALIAGGEARQRAVLATRTGHDALDTIVPGAPDELLLPIGDIITAIEIERDLAVPAHQYALVESALRHNSGITAEQQVDLLGNLWASFARVAAANPFAWDRSNPDAHKITTASPDNRMIATPYTKRLCSQWNVDQAAALIVTSVATATAAGVTPNRWVFPLVSAESQAMIPLPERAELARSIGTKLVGQAAFRAIDITVDDIDYFDVYSCFPAAVQVQMIELGISIDTDGNVATGKAKGRPLTLTGGMTFAGGPLNSYALHATAAMAATLRDEPGAIGLVTSVSGMLTKPAVALWSTLPPSRRFSDIDVTTQTLTQVETVTIDRNATGYGTIAASSVLCDRGVPSRVVAVIECADGSRTIAVDYDQQRAEAGMHEDLVGSSVEVGPPGQFARC